MYIGYGARRTRHGCEIYLSGNPVIARDITSR